MMSKNQLMRKFLLTKPNKKYTPPRTDDFLLDFLCRLKNDSSFSGDLNTDTLEKDSEQ